MTTHSDTQPSSETSLSAEALAAEASEEARRQEERAREAALVQRCQQGDEAAFAELVDSFRERAFWVAYQLIGDIHEARDLTQEAFLRVFRSIHSFELGKNFFTWLYRIVTNLAIDHLRKARSRQAVPLEVLAEVQDDNAAAHSIAAARELSGEVRHVLDQIPPRYRQVLTMRDLLDLTCKEIGHITGSKHATVRWQLHQARKLFREAWETTYGVAGPDARDQPDQEREGTDDPA